MSDHPTSRLCLICGNPFAPSHYYPKQRVCTDPACKGEYRRRKMVAIRAANPGYGQPRNRKSQRNARHGAGKDHRSSLGVLDLMERSETRRADVRTGEIMTCPCGSGSVLQRGRDTCGRCL
jgi:hypothetical protein